SQYYGQGSMLRRKGQSSGFCGAARASTRRLRPSASGLPLFSGFGLKWALSKARPQPDAAKNETRAVGRRGGARTPTIGRLPGGSNLGREKFDRVSLPQTSSSGEAARIG